MEQEGFLRMYSWEFKVVEISKKGSPILQKLLISSLCQSTMPSLHIVWYGLWLNQWHAQLESAAIKTTLECRKWGFKTWAFKQIRRCPRKKRPFRCIFWISLVLFWPSGGGRKRQKWDWQRTEKADFQAGKQDTLKTSVCYAPKYHYTHKIITELNFISFELLSVIPVLWLPNRIVPGINSSR